MKALAALAALTLTFAAAVVPALARDGYVVDDAHLLSQNAITQINSQVDAFHAQTGKEVVVVTTPSLDGQPAQSVAERDFAQQQVNGVMIFIAKQPKTIGIVPDRAASRYFPSGSLDTIRTAMRASFNAGNFDEGVTTGVGLILNTYRSHLGSAPGAQRQPVGSYGGGTVVRQNASGGSGLGWIWWVIILAVIFFVIRGIFRAMSGPRNYGPGPGPGYGGPGYGGPGYGGPGYGGGYGYGGGGGGFWSGLLGGLGGAFLGNELFGNRGNSMMGGPGTYAGMGDPGNPAGGDASGWQSDAGQADMGNASFGGFGGGDSGGGWGGGDSGGGFGGGDSGGGWGGGDSGGGW